jgi:neutral trehalase
MPEGETAVQPASHHEADGGQFRQSARGGASAERDDARNWREAARLRREHPGWVVLWLDRTGEYRAYRLRQARHDSVLAAATPADLVAQIGEAERAARTPPAARH